MRKRVVFIANTMEIARKFKTVLSGFEVDVSTGTSTRVDKLAGQGPHADLVIFELQESTESFLRAGELVDLMACCGFRGVSVRRRMMGACVLHIGHKPRRAREVRR